MKKPEEIKSGLGCDVYSVVGCYLMKCPYRHGPCTPDSGAELRKDALSLIQQLEAENAELLEKVEQLERERDADVRDCACFPCYTCRERENGDNCGLCKCESGTSKRSNHKWRGPCEENEEIEK